VVLVSSRSNPTAVAVIEGAPYHWYEYHVDKMADADLLRLFAELAGESGLDQRIHMDDPQQQKVLRKICTLLDGYPLGAELIFGAARSIDGKVFTPEAATRSLEEVCDELRDSQLAGISAVLDVANRRLTPHARLLLSYLAAFRLPFSREQIILIVAPENQATAPTNDAVAGELVQHWRVARDELVQASFMQFDGRVYTIHPQIRNFALLYLPLQERRRVHRAVAHYYRSQPQPSPEEWFAAYEHQEAAGETQDLQEAILLAVHASWAMGGRGHAPALLDMLRRAEAHASRLGNNTAEG